MKQPSFTPEIDNCTLLFDLFPVHISRYLQKHYENEILNEIVFDLGKKPEVRVHESFTILKKLPEITHTDLHHIIENVGQFNSDNRAGIERTLHRISAIRNRSGQIIGLTCRVGRAIFGTIDIIRDIIERQESLLILGPPGSGKTTLLRESARILSNELKKRVIVVDTSNEIAGDGDIPHTGIGHARRMQVPSPNQQHTTMIEAVENHTPEIIIVDEIGTEEEAHTARTIAERGVHLIATAHGRTLENLIKNPILSDLIGGVQSVILGDEEAKFRGTKKTVLERKSRPTFDMIIEMKDKNTFAIYHNVIDSIDKILEGEDPNPEIRIRNTLSSLPHTHTETKETHNKKTPPTPTPPQKKPHETLHIYAYGIKSTQINLIIKTLAIPAELVRSINDADIILTTESKIKNNSKIQTLTQNRNIPIHVIKSHSQENINNFFKWIFKLSAYDHEIEEEAMAEIKELCTIIQNEQKTLEAAPRPRSIRQQQHEYIQAQGFNSGSIGDEPNRRVRIYPVEKKTRP